MDLSVISSMNFGKKQKLNVLISPMMQFKRLAEVNFY